jgi:hypothetical protein
VAGRVTLGEVEGQTGAKGQEHIWDCNGRNAAEYVGPQRGKAVILKWLATI